MARITDITMQRNGKRANIFVDGRFKCGLENITVLSSGLKIGQETDDETLEALQLSSEMENAFNKALSYVSLRRRTEKEVRLKLREKGYLNSVIDAATGKLKDYGYIDDTKYAEDYVAMYKSRFGEIRLRAELRRLGIAEKTVNDVLSELDEDEIYQSALSAAEKYLQSHDFDRPKLSRHLAAKGYSYGVVGRAIRAVEKEK